MATGFQVTFDAADPAKLAAFWAAVLGYITDPPPPGFESWEEVLRQKGIPEERWNDANAIVDPAGAGPRIFFQRVPEGKTAKNRVHLDVNVGGPRQAPPEERRRAVVEAAERAVAIGATKLYEKDGQFGEWWITLADPEGNEFCMQ